MRQDSLEKFILNHRDDFDDIEPGEGLFDKIVLEKPQPKKSIIRKIYFQKIVSRAASILIIIALSVSGTLFVQHKLNNEDPIREAVVPSDTPASMVSGIQEAESYYQVKIQQRRSEFYTLAKTHPGVARDVAYEYASLDSAYLELKLELRQNINNEQIVEAMIQNYRLKLELLEDILSQLNQSKQNTESKREQKYEL